MLGDRADPLVLGARERRGDRVREHERADAGPRRLVGNYDYTLSMDGSGDFASGQSDATLFGLVGSSGVTFGFDPTGNSAAANDPNYDSTMVLESFTISGQVGGAVSSMDQATQQNAALVEEMAAAASSLKQQAVELVRAALFIPLLKTLIMERLTHVL